MWRETQQYIANKKSGAISIHSLRVEGDPSYVASLSLNLPISIHSLRVEGDWQPPGYDTLTAAISIHSLRVEGDEATRKRGGRERHFNPLPPCGGRQKQSTPKQKRRAFQSTPSVWRETAAKRTAMPQYPISIHSLRVEGDCDNIFFCRRRKDFNPLPPCGGRQWTAPAFINASDFNPLPPCGGRLSEISERVKLTLISIHSLRVEGDKKAYVMYQQETALGITSSPHATDFNPLPPCGGRRRFTGYTVHKRTFQSTPSVWRETRYSESLTLSTPFQSTPSVWRETQ